MFSYVNALLKKHRIAKFEIIKNVGVILLFAFIYAYLMYSVSSTFNNNNTVPKILHKLTKDLKPDDITTDFYNECKEMYNRDGWIVRTWYDKDIDEFVKRTYPSYYKRFNEIQPHIKKVDAVRYLIMHYYGGVYADMDSECLRPMTRFIEGLPHDTSTAWITGYPEPWFLMSVPGNYFWIYAFEKILRDWNKYNVRSTAGPQGLNRMLQQYAMEYGQDVFQDFSMSDKSECVIIQPPGDVKLNEKTHRWIISKEDFKKSEIKVEHKIGFLPNQIFDPTACLAKIKSCKYKHCHDRDDLVGAFFVHHCHYSWKPSKNV